MTIDDECDHTFFYDNGLFRRGRIVTHEKGKRLTPREVRIPVKCSECHQRGTEIYRFHGVETRDKFYSVRRTILEDKIE